MATINTAAEKRAYKKFISAGMTPAGACALIGNAEAESDGFYTNRVEYLCIRRLKENGRTYTDETYTAAVDEGKISAEEFLHPLPGKQYGYGIVQWTSPGRKSGLWNLAKRKGVSIADEDMQFEYLLSELENSYPSVLKTLKTATDIRAASDVVLTKFEMPSDTGEAVRKSRAERGQKFYDAYVKSSKEKSSGSSTPQTGGKTMTETQLRQKVVGIMQGWVGKKESDGSHKSIIDIYNGHKPLARGYAVKYTDAWCATCVSAAAISAGLTDIIPTECGCGEMIKLFSNLGEWQESDAYIPAPGDVIFYDWDDSGVGDNKGGADHVGIVEKVENGIVYTIEGNSGDKVCENQYSIGNKEILGYGYYSGNNTVATGDAAQQVWTYLKSYGYSDSVAAGIIGNMMRECGGDTLNLDWNIVGHYNGDEFYGLCQWCLKYTPSGFKGSTIKEQCEYLQKTIKSEFANYGGNYNGITYSQFLKSDTRTAAIAFERVYERCGDYANEDTRRANNAEKAYNKFHK